MEFLFQARQTCVLSCVSSEWSLATNSGSYRFQISYFNIANHSGTHMQKAQGKNIALLLPFMGLLESKENGSDHGFSGRPLEAVWLTLGVLPLLAAISLPRHTLANPPSNPPAAHVPCLSGAPLIFMNFCIQRIQSTFWQKIMTFTEVSLHGKYSSVESACSKIFL